MATNGTRTPKPEDIEKHYSQQDAVEEVQKPAKRKLSTSAKLILGKSGKGTGKDGENDGMQKKGDSSAFKNYPPLIRHFMACEKIVTPLPLQTLVWPSVINGTSVHVIAEPGSGKTLSYLLPAACRISESGHSMATRPKGALALVLLPTRELAQQVCSVCKRIKRHCGVLRVACLTGGSEKERQIESLKRGPHILVATPGRLVDLIEDNKVDLGMIWYSCRRIVYIDRPGTKL